jgi:soluble lytic murein transglycosylase-like protein
MDTLSLLLIFSSVTTQLNLPAKLLPALCYVESKHNVAAIHHDDGATDSLGICQIKLETAKWLGFKGTKQQLMNPKINIYYAGLYLQRNIKRYNGNVIKAIIAYNRGNAKNLTTTVYSTKVIKQWGVQK